MKLRATHSAILVGVNTIVVDKTGTLTQGKPSVVGIKSVGIDDDDEVIELVVACKSHGFPHGSLVKFAVADEAVNLLGGLAFPLESESDPSRDGETMSQGT